MTHQSGNNEESPEDKAARWLTRLPRNELAGKVWRMIPNHMEEFEKTIAEAGWTVDEYLNLDLAESKENRDAAFRECFSNGRQPNQDDASS